MTTIKTHISNYSFLEHKGILHCSGGLPLGVLLFTCAFQNRKPPKPGLAYCKMNRLNSFILTVLTIKSSMQYVPNTNYYILFLLAVYTVVGGSKYSLCLWLSLLVNVFS